MLSVLLRKHFHTKSKNIVFARGAVGREDRWKAQGFKGVTVWMNPKLKCVHRTMGYSRINPVTSRFLKFWIHE